MYRVNPCTHARTHTQTQTHADTHIRTHTHTNRHTHTDRHTQRQPHPDSDTAAAASRRVNRAPEPSALTAPPPISLSLYTPISLSLCTHIYIIYINIYIFTYIYECTWAVCTAGHAPPTPSLQLLYVHTRIFTAIENHLSRLHRACRRRRPYGVRVAQHREDRLVRKGMEVRMYIYIYIYIYIYLYIYIYTHTHTYIYTHTYICTHIHTHTHIYLYLYIYLSLSLSIHIHVHINTVIFDDHTACVLPSTDRIAFQERSGAEVSFNYDITDRVNPERCPVRLSNFQAVSLIQRVLMTSVL